MTKSIDAIIDGFVACGDNPESGPRAHLTLYVPLETKQKFDNLQTKSRRKFGKKLQEVVAIAVERAKLDDAS